MTMVGIMAEEELPRRHEELTSEEIRRLAESHQICMDPTAFDDEVLEALDHLVTSVEEEFSNGPQIETAVGGAMARSPLFIPAELAARIARIEGLEIYAAQMRTTPFEVLLELACAADPQVAKAARDTLRMGPLDVSEKDRWTAAVSLLPGVRAEGEPSDLAREVLSTLEVLFD